MSYNFEEMVNEAYQTLAETNSEGCNKLVLPKIETNIETTRMHWKNVKEFLKVVCRHPDHFMAFLKSELPDKEINWFSGSKSDGLLIHGKRLKQTLIVEMSMKYINMYVLCPSCGKCDTSLNKFDSRLLKFECHDCGTTKYFEALSAE